MLNMEFRSSDFNVALFRHKKKMEKKPIIKQNNNFKDKFTTLIIIKYALTFLLFIDQVHIFTISFKLNKFIILWKKDF